MIHSEMPTFLNNGAELLKTRKMNDGTYIVLAYWPSSEYHPWVTWRMSKDLECFWGHYFDNQSDADTDFVTRNV